MAALGGIFDAVIIGGSLSGAACAKRLVDAGFHTLVVEKKKLPRPKTCSGIISPRGHRFLLENFGPIPKEALHCPASLRGVTFHYPSMLEMPMDFHHGPTPHLNRKHADHWALKRSGAEVLDGASLTGLEDEGRCVKVIALREGEEIKLKARCVIGADGPNSKVIRLLYREYTKSIPWFMVKQFFHEIIECPLDDGYFHFWVHPALGFYTWSHARGGGQIVGVGYEGGDDLRKRHGIFLNYLGERYGVRLTPEDNREGSVNNFGLSIINRYVFGRGNVIVTGQAAGFLNMIGEGMSCALHSGAIAGEAAVESLRFGKDIQETYRRMIASEVRRSSDQWNPFKIIFGSPHEADFMKALRKHSVPDRIRIVKDIASFLKPWGRFKWGRQIMVQALKRNFLDAYSPSRWL